MSAVMASATWRKTGKGVAHSFCNLVKMVGATAKTFLHRTATLWRGIPSGDREIRRDRTAGGPAGADILGGGEDQES